MAKRDRREVISRLVVLLSHLLKWENQPERRSGSWRGTMRAQRRELRQLLESGTLRNHAEAVLADAYSEARRQAADETELNTDVIPFRELAGLGRIAGGANAHFKARSRPPTRMMISRGMTALPREPAAELARSTIRRGDCRRKTPLPCGERARAERLRAEAVDVKSVPSPNDCLDGFTEAYYARPEQLLDPSVRRSQSAWSFISDEAQARFVERLGGDLRSGVSDRRFGGWRTEPYFLGSLRLIVSSQN